MKYFEISENKTLKLTNVLIKTLIEEDFENFEKSVEQMEDYIKSKGYQPLGPLIQYTTTKVNENVTKLGITGVAGIIGVSLGVSTTTVVAALAWAF